jgi:hypothetical protein
VHGEGCEGTEIKVRGAYECTLARIFVAHLPLLAFNIRNDKGESLIFPAPRCTMLLLYGSLVYSIRTFFWMLLIVLCPENRSLERI